MPSKPASNSHIPGYGLSLRNEFGVHESSGWMMVS